MTDGVGSLFSLEDASSIASHVLELTVGLVAAWCVTVWSKPLRSTTGGIVTAPNINLKLPSIGTKSKRGKADENQKRQEHQQRKQQRQMDKSTFAGCLFGGVVCGEVFCVFLKRMVRQQRPSPTMCGKQDEAGDFGMPSSHAELAFFLITYLMCVVSAKHMSSKETKQSSNTGGRSKFLSFLRWLVHLIAIIGCALVSALAIAASRVPLGCHTTTQVAAGALLGLAQGFFWWFAVQPWLASIPGVTRNIVRLLHYLMPPHSSKYLIVAQLSVAAVVTLFSAEPSRFLRFLFLHGRYTFLSDVVLLLLTLLFAILVLKISVKTLWPLLLSIVAVCYIRYRFFAVPCDLSTVVTWFVVSTGVLFLGIMFHRFITKLIRNESD